MARITWLGEDEIHNGGAGPSFTTAFGLKFPKGEAVDIHDEDTVLRASRNPYFKVEIPAIDRAIEAVPEPDPVDDLKGMSIAELRNLAEASGIDHSGMSKAELRDAIRAHDASNE